MSWFNSQSKLIQIILMLIPGVNWIVEMFVRITAVLENPKTTNIIGLIIGIFGNIIFAYIDLICILLYGHLLFAD